jgi:hypothetical protein
MRLDTYRSAGFLVTRRLPRPGYSAADLLPTLIVSASSDIATFVPDVWAIAWCGVEPEDRRAEAAKLGIAPERVEGLVAAVTARVADAERYGWPNIAFSLDAAWEMARLAAPEGGLLVLELGLARDQVPALLDASAVPEPQPGMAPIGEAGVRTALRRDLPVLASGRALGFEPLCFNTSLGCSWLCNGLEVAVARELGIRPNSSGLLSDCEEARRAVAYITRDDVGAEPGLWLPWLLLEHNRA